MTSSTLAPAVTDAARSNPAAVVRRAALVVGLVAIAAIHVADLPGKMEEVPYIGWMYVGLIAACLIVAELLITRPSRTAFVAAAGLAAATFVGFVLTRTTGLPSATDDIGNWSEPLGLVSIFVEVVVVWFGARALSD